MTLTPLTVETCRAMLAHLSPDMTRDEWAAVAMALKAELGEVGFDLFDAWSQRGEKYRAEAVRSTWRSIKASGGRTGATLVHMAKAAGWRPESVQTPAHAPTPAELKAKAAERHAAAERERQAQAERHRQGAAEAARLWALASDEGESAYLIRKGVSNHGGRFGSGGVFLVPARDAAGELWNLQTIKGERPSDGAPEKLFLKGARKTGTLHMIGNPEAAPWLLVAEGYATAASLHEATGRPVAVAWDAGNLQHVVRALRGRFPAARLAVCGDDDTATQARTGTNPGRVKATEAARLARGPAIFPEGLPEGGSDWNDLHQSAGLEAVRAQVEAALQAAEASGGARTPDRAKKTQPAGQDRAARGGGDDGAYGGAGGAGEDDEGRPAFDPFTLDEHGVWFRGFSPQGKPLPLLRVCGPLRVTARTRLRNQAGWGYLLEFEDDEGNPKEWVIGAGAMQGDGVRYREALADQGLNIEPGRSPREKLAQYILSRQPQAFARLIERTGWHADERVYVLPGGRVFGECGERMVLAPEAVNEHPFRKRGDPKRWRATIGRVCEGNTRPTFGVSAALAGPLLRLAGLQSGGFHFVGPSSKGKSSSLFAAASVWGSPAFRRLWRNSDNAAEYLAQLHSDSLLILDEIKQCEPRLVGEVIYMLGNGAGKGRSKTAGGLRPTPEWLVLFLSAGELTPEQHMASVKMQAFEGQRVRMPSIPAFPKGCVDTVFEMTHDLPDHAALSKYFEHQAAEHYGYAGPAFLQRVAADVDEVKDRLRAGIAQFRDAHVPDTADGQIGRIADRFAVVAVAGELATEYGITGWPKGWATKAAAACFYGMVDMRLGGFGSGEEAAMLRQVRTLIAEHREDWFQDWDRADEGDNHRPNAPRGVGWRKPIKEAGEVARVEYVCLPDPFRSMLCDGLPWERVLEVLDQRGHLEREKGHMTVKRRLPGLGNVRHYVIRSSILDDMGDE